MVRHATTSSRKGKIRFQMSAGAIYSVFLVAITAQPVISSALAGGAQAKASAATLELDKFGARGSVSFNHDNHATRQNPDPNAKFKTGKGASCSGCHHTLDAVSGAPQLWKCSACHRGGGDPKNPKGRDGDEQWSETAYHNLCIGCHVASTKGPTKCGDCHQLRDAQR